MEKLNKINDMISKIIQVIAGVLLAIMVVVTFWQVVVRLIKGSLPWSEEAARYMQVYLTFLGVSVGVKYNELVAVEAIYDAVPNAMKKGIRVFVHLVIGFVLAILIVYGMKLVQITLIQSSPVMGIKMGYIYFAIVLGSALMFVHNVINLLNLLTGYKGLESEATTRIEVQG